MIHQSSLHRIIVTRSLIACFYVTFSLTSLTPTSSFLIKNHQGIQFPSREISKVGSHQPRPRILLQGWGSRRGSFGRCINNGPITYHPCRSWFEETFSIQGAHRILSTAIASVLILCFADCVLPSPAFASSFSVSTISITAETSGVFDSSFYVADKSSLDSEEFDINDLGLEAPTEEHPQIMFSGMSSIGKSRTPLIQGLVYFLDQTENKSKLTKELDPYSDFLVLTAVPAAEPDGPILAGAKIPISSIRFPFMFEMHEENLLLKKAGLEDSWFGSRETDGGVPLSQDVLVVARICPSDSGAFPCDDAETKKYASGIAKLITNLPGLKEGEVVRAPASLPLQ